MYLKPCLILPAILIGLIKGITSSSKPRLVCIMFAESHTWGVVGLKQSPTGEVRRDTAQVRQTTSFFLCFCCSKFSLLKRH